MSSLRPSARLRAALVAGDRLAQFRIVGKIGEGGMGTIYKAFDEKLKRTVALKVLLPAHVDDEDRRARLLREARAAAAVTHANIAAVHEVGVADDRLFIAMEYVQGVTLRKALAGRLELREAMRIGKAIARALVKAHGKGIVHRDLKPDNVMIAEDGEVKVLDFGLAKQELPPDATETWLDSEAKATDAFLSKEGRVAGTAGYMSPEQVLGENTDPRTDFFSFGAVLFEMVTGQRAFGGRLAIERFIATTRDEPPPVSSLNPDASPLLDAVVARCLAKRPGDRYADARELLRELDAVDGERSSLVPDASESAPRVPGEPEPSGPSVPSAPSAPTAPAPHVAPSPLSRRRVVATSAATAVALSIVVVAIVSAVRRPAQKTPGGAPPEPSTVAAPRSSNAEAEALYESGVARQRTMSWHSGCARLARASDLDPAFASAAYGAAVCYARSRPSVGREYFRRARDTQANLSEVERAILEAFEPVYQHYPPDWENAHVSRLQSAAARFPGEPMVHLLLGSALAHRADLAAGVAEFDKALAIDPKLMRAMQLEGEYFAYDGRFDDARRVLNACVTAIPTAVNCMSDLTDLEGELGQCDTMEAQARSALMIDPDHDVAYDALATALVARARPLDSAREVLRQKRTRPDVTAGDRAREEAAADTQIAMVAGDFPGALEGARRFDDALGSETAVGPHAWVARRRVEAYLESGKNAEAVRAAKHFLDRRDGWDPDPRGEDWAIAEDPTGFMLGVLHRAGALTDDQLASKRAAWLAQWGVRAMRPSINYVWVHQVGAGVDTRDEGEAALALLPQYMPIPLYFAQTLGGYHVGHAFLAAGRVGDALPWLQQAARSCHALDLPYEHTHALFTLGQAEEQNGDTSGACAAYASVVERWGHARPRSVTAEGARKRVAALGCTK
jgi:serine/threonine protein kinase/tetratricopeptide (TPR) repeat protein